MIMSQFFSPRIKKNCLETILKIHDLHHSRWRFVGETSWRDKIKNLKLKNGFQLSWNDSSINQWMNCQRFWWAKPLKLWGFAGVFSVSYHCKLEFLWVSDFCSDETRHSETSLWALGTCDVFLHHFLTFYGPNLNKVIKNKGQINRWTGFKGLPSSASARPLGPTVLAQSHTIIGDCG